MVYFWALLTAVFVGCSVLDIQNDLTAEAQATGVAFAVFSFLVFIVLLVEHAIDILQEEE